MDFLCCGLGIDFEGFLDFGFLLFHLLAMEGPLQLERSPKSGGVGASPGRDSVCLETQCSLEEPRLGRGGGENTDRLWVEGLGGRGKCWEWGLGESEHPQRPL